MMKKTMINFAVCGVVALTSLSTINYLASNDENAITVRRNANLQREHDARRVAIRTGLGQYNSPNAREMVRQNNRPLALSDANISESCDEEISRIERQITILEDEINMKKKNKIIKHDNEKENPRMDELEYEILKLKARRNHLIYFVK